MIQKIKNTVERSLKKYDRKGIKDGQPQVLKRSTISLSLFLLFAFCFLLLFLWWRDASSAADPKDTAAYDFLITRGQSGSSVARKLKSQGLIKSPFAFRLYTQVTGKDKKIQAGQYQLSPNLTIPQIVDLLASGPKELWVTYPEGIRREEIAAKTIKTLGMTGQVAETFWQQFLAETEGKEGFLFPDTYLFPRDVEAAAVIEKLTATFAIKLREDTVARGKGLGLDKAEVVTLASIIERETRGNEEKPTVAGILIKRLKNKWPLDVDATLQYALANEKCNARGTRGTFDTCGTSDFNWWPRPSPEDKTIRSPYNTYTNRGLPPGPIANPGLSSLEIAVNPQDSPYWFYLHDAEGKIHYAKTIEEHQENIDKYLR